MLISDSKSTPSPVLGCTSGFGLIRTTGLVMARLPRVGTPSIVELPPYHGRSCGRIGINRSLTRIAPSPRCRDIAWRMADSRIEIAVLVVLPSSMAI
ncbi:uncharacterized protein MYCFIDRAFT_179623 [Pseudocercospora fijiensis CIRAD86]|uniref:Uncharacterized protein n=1 Tax=Pseudocercospora fijiensis (strain CIRAD86) TaxID=383855 RepID=M2ZGD6_PSEFD|nr:uncharacterized protein MYCFIDRAFT_179623 [Pseudocercospora fijiensis CIRAD86]EME78184.1 hypothetical protein MYCFIDRAFT_179623 [Pseudocercospora fijiensis CIRAD86]